MAKDPEIPARRTTYRSHTLRPLNSLIFILPMLLGFQVGAAVYGTSLLAPRDMQGILERLGATAAHLPAILIVLVLFLQHLLRRDPWELQPKVLAGMFGESIIWMIPLIVMIHLTGRLRASLSAPGPYGEGIIRDVLQAFGAGIYEEFIFRLVFVSLVLLIFVDMLGLKKEVLTVIAVIAAAIAFSIYHLPGEQLSPAQTSVYPRAIFRALAGIYLGTIFVYRGFGIAVGAHAFYNIYALVAKP